MKEISRRGFLKTTAGVLGGLAIVGSVKGNEAGYNPEKDLASKTIENSEPVLEEIGLTDERLKIIAERNWKMQQLSIWMKKNGEKIFANAPNNELYAVGIWKKERPEIHYFNDKYKEVFPFQLKSQKKGEVNNFIYKYQSELVLML